MKDKIRGGIISLVIGDALGVPVEFKDRSFLRENPVFNPGNSHNPFITAVPVYVYAKNNN